MSRNSNYGNNFIEHEKFIKLCDDLDIKLAGYSNDEGWLEFLEKNKILFPQKRIIIPRGYKRIIFDIQYNPKNKYYNKSSIYIPNKYDPVHKLLDKTVYTGIYNRDFFHILHKANYLTRKCVCNPIEKNFRKWDSFETVAGKLSGSDHWENRAEHYYAYWQVYYMYEINEACTQKYVTNIFNKRIRNEIFKHRIASKKN
ncbi:MAG: hypothetical protein M1495_23940 [Bacteroidetes bacterium]|nr:hypothetical protein [Bacteroidota bacterium]